MKAPATVRYVLDDDPAFPGSLIELDVDVVIDRPECGATSEHPADRTTWAITDCTVVEAIGPDGEPFEPDALALLAMIAERESFADAIAEAV